MEGSLALPFPQRQALGKYEVLQRMRTAGLLWQRETPNAQSPRARSQTWRSSHLLMLAPHDDDWCRWEVA